MTARPECTYVPETVDTHRSRKPRVVAKENAGQRGALDANQLDALTCVYVRIQQRATRESKGNHIARYVRWYGSMRRGFLLLLRLRTEDDTLGA